MAREIACSYEGTGCGGAGATGAVIGDGETEIGTVGESEEAVHTRRR